MRVIPAIDLRGGQVVRLLQGDYGRETVYSDDPVGVATGFARQGAPLIHLVDLDGARTGRPSSAVNEIVARIAEDVGVPVQVGGGLRTSTDVEAALLAGASRVVLGSRAVTDPAWVAALTTRHPGQVVVALDSRRGKLVLEGWLESSSVGTLQAATGLMAHGVTEFVYTPTERDGTGRGPDFDGVRSLLELGCRVVASGGVGSLGDIGRLAAMGVSGVIIGRALYDGAFTLKEAITCVV